MPTAWSRPRTTRRAHRTAPRLPPTTAAHTWGAGKEDASPSELSTRAREWDSAHAPTHDGVCVRAAQLLVEVERVDKPQQREAREAAEEQCAKRRVSKTVEARTAPNEGALILARDSALGLGVTPSVVLCRIHIPLELALAKRAPKAVWVPLRESSWPLPSPIDAGPKKLQRQSAPPSPRAMSRKTCCGREPVFIRNWIGFFVCVRPRFFCAPCCPLTAPRLSAWEPSTTWLMWW